jgi:hypothetical protein
MPSNPNQMLRGNLRALDRYGTLVHALGSPRDEVEQSLLVMLARLLSDEELATLLMIVKRREPQQS